MVWLWVSPLNEVGGVYAEYDDVRSLVPSSDITYAPSLKNTRQDQIVLVIRKLRNMAVLDRHHCLPGSNAAPLVDKTIKPILEKFAPGAIEFVPVTVLAKGLEIKRFSFARPLTVLDCLDMEQSEINYTLKIGNVVTVHDYGELVLKPNCLGEHHLARLRTPKFTMVSEELKQALEATGDPGIDFEKPKDFWKRIWANATGR